MLADQHRGHEGGSGGVDVTIAPDTRAAVMIANVLCGSRPTPARSAFESPPTKAEPSAKARLYQPRFSAQRPRVKSGNSTGALPRATDSSLRAEGALHAAAS